MILTPVTIEQWMVDEIVNIGKMREPIEACGIILPVPHRGKSIYEMPNRSMTPDRSFLIQSNDILTTLEGWVAAHPSHAAWNKIVIWHTHPSGHVGPSELDLQFRIEQCGNLVVNLGDDPKATWF
jgi:proteasome lid subunit RPN8/RPN11